jgi:hypothetical protein
VFSSATPLDLRPFLLLLLAGAGESSANASAAVRLLVALPVLFLLSARDPLMDCAMYAYLALPFFLPDRGG